MEIEMDGTEKVADYVTVPPGSYLCTIAEVRPGVTRNGDERWGIRLVVAEGEFTGRLAAWDGLSFSERGRARARRVLRALGFARAGTIEIEPEDLAGRSAIVTVRPAEYADPATGEPVRRNEVPYDGYRSAGATDEGRPTEPPGTDGETAADDLPF